MLLALTAALLFAPSRASAIPAFARAYDVPCASCHSFITRRHQFGDAFRKAGYHWPTAADTQPADLDATELRGTSVLSGLLPRTVPFAIEGTVSAAHTTDESVDQLVTAGNPTITVLLGAAFGDHVSTFGTWNGSGPPSELYLHFARLADRPELNLMAGLFEQSTTLFKANEQLIARHLIGSSDVSGFTVSQARLGVEANGVLWDRSFWAAGVVQNGDIGSHWDGYYRLEHKLGGMDLLGTEPEIDLMAEPCFWEEVHATAATWGYLGEVRDLDGNPTSRIRRLGLEGKLFVHGFNLWGGLMLGFDEDVGLDRDVRSITWFGEIYYPITSWLAPVYAYQYQDSAQLERERQQHDVGLIVLLLENVRARAKFSFSDDEQRNDTIEAQLLAAF